MAIRATEAQKKMALKEFNLGEKSKYWNKTTKSIGACALGKQVGVSDYAIKDWYAKWKIDNNTTLERSVTNLSKEKLEDLKFDYYEKLATGVRITEVEAAVKYGVSRGTVKGWKVQYKKSGGVVTRNYRLPKKVVAPSAEQSESKVENPQQVFPQNQPEKVVSDVHVNGNSIEILDAFFNDVPQMKDRIKKMETEITTYKTKCEKWASQVVNLQSILVAKG